MYSNQKIQNAKSTTVAVTQASVSEEDQVPVSARPTLSSKDDSKSVPLVPVGLQEEQTLAGWQTLAANLTSSDNSQQS